MSDTPPVIWICGSGEARRRVAPLLEALDGLGSCLILGDGSQGQVHLDLGPQPDLSLALESCPPEMRPRLCLWLGDGQGPPPAGLTSLPCPVLGLGEDAPEGRLPAEPWAAAQTLGQALVQGLRLPWMAGVQVNVPLRDLLGQYCHLVGLHPLNPEVGIDHQALDTLGPADLQQARAILAGRRVSAHLPFGDLVPGSPDPQVAALAGRRLLAAGQWALELGAVQAVLHLGFEPRLHQDAQPYAQRLAATLAPLARLLAGGGCRLVMENTFELEPSPLLLCRQALARASGVEVGFCLDVGHASCFSRTGLPAWWRALSPHLSEMHLHDNDGLGDQHLPPGQGRVDWGFLAQELAALPQAPLLTLEPHAEPHLWASLRALERLWGRPGDQAWAIDGGGGPALT
ncbi:MAG: sugar phosphate isomerase/epimerase [Desulfarculus sp.]|nr:sugar phosphate isomerase/epimerase [Desulfarculus sp.]